MKKIEKTVEVKVTKYVAKDGKEFDDAAECILYERKLKGEIKECPECHGEGRISKWVQGENYHTGAPEEYLEHHTCMMCKGKGYLEKKTTWK